MRTHTTTHAGPWSTASTRSLLAGSSDSRDDLRSASGSRHATDDVRRALPDAIDADIGSGVTCAAMSALTSHAEGEVQELKLSRSWVQRKAMRPVYTGGTIAVRRSARRGACMGMNRRSLTHLTPTAGVP